MADQNLTIGIRADASQLRTDLAVVNAEISALNRQLKVAATESLVSGDRSGVGSIAAQIESAVGHQRNLKAEMALSAAEAGNFTHRFKEGMKESAESLEKLRGGFRGGAEGLLGGGFLGLSGGQIALAATVGALGELFHLASEAAERAHQIGTLSAALGASTGEVKEWTRAANKAGVDTELYNKNMERLAVNAEKAADGLRKNVLEATKLSGLVPEDASTVRRGGREDKFAAPINMTELAKDSPQLHRFVESQIEDLKKLNVEAVRAGQAPVPLPSFESALLKVRVALEGTTEAAKKLRDEASKFGVDVGFKTVGEGLDRLAPKWRDNFTKMRVDLIDTTGKMAEYAKVKDGFLSGLAKLPETERLGIQKSEFGKTGIEPRFSAEIKAEGDRLNAGGAPAQKFEDPKVVAGEETAAYLIRIKGEWRDTLDDFSLSILKWGRDMDVVLGFAKEGGGAHGAAKALSDDVHGADTSLSDLAHAASASAEEIDHAVAKINAAKITSQDGFPGGYAPIPGNAAGGFIRGPGSGTSDSILARVSNGEFVVNAAATSQNLSLLHSINSGFARGGSVGFAAGGLVGGGGTPVHLHIGGDSFPLYGSHGVVASLVRAARQGQMTSAGKKPSWVGG